MLLFLGVDNSSLIHVNYKKKGYLNSWNRTNKKIRLQHNRIAAEAKYSINFTKSKKGFFKSVLK